MLRALGEKQIYRIPARRADNPLLKTDYGMMLDRIPGVSRAAEACWRGNPRDPMLYYYYISSLVYCDKELPKDYEATWKLIDPDNAFWPLLQARLGLAPPLVRVFGPLDGFLRPASSVPPDPAKVLELLQQAAQLAGCHSYEVAAANFEKNQRRDPVTYIQAANLSDSVLIKSFGSWQALSKEASGRQSELSVQDPHGYERVAGWLDQMREESTTADELIDASMNAQSLNHEPFAGMMMVLRAQSVISGGVFWVLTVVLLLRHFPTRRAASRLALCAGRLLEPRGLLRLVVKYVAAPVLILAGFACALIFVRVMDENLIVYFAMLPAAIMLAALVLMTGSARREVSRRTAFLGLRGSGFQRKLEWLPPTLALAPLVLDLLLLLVIAVIHHAGGSLQEQIVVGAGACCYGVALLWLGAKWLLGVVSPTANIRHRLIASRLVPVMLIATVSLNLFALCLHPAETYLVKRGLHLPPGNGKR
jgi:hypothetical protein